MGLLTESTLIPRKARDIGAAAGGALDASSLSGLRSLIAAKQSELRSHAGRKRGREEGAEGSDVSYRRAALQRLREGDASGAGEAGSGAGGSSAAVLQGSNKGVAARSAADARQAAAEREREQSASGHQLALKARVYALLSGQSADDADALAGLDVRALPLSLQRRVAAALADRGGEGGEVQGEGDFLVDFRSHRHRTGTSASADASADAAADAGRRCGDGRMPVSALEATRLEWEQRMRGEMRTGASGSSNRSSHSGERADSGSSGSSGSSGGSGGVTGVTSSDVLRGAGSRDTGLVKMSWHRTLNDRDKGYLAAIMADTARARTSSSTSEPAASASAAEDTEAAVAALLAAAITGDTAALQTIQQVRSGSGTAPPAAGESEEEEDEEEEEEEAVLAAAAERRQAKVAAARQLLDALFAPQQQLLPAAAPVTTSMPVFATREAAAAAPPAHAAAQQLAHQRDMRNADENEYDQQDGQYHAVPPPAELLGAEQVQGRRSAHGGSRWR